MSGRPGRAPTRDGAPFSRPLDVDDIPDSGMDIEIAAEPHECEVVAKDIRLPAITSLSGRYRVERRPGGLIEVRGELVAKIVQSCVVSLDLFESEITAPVEIEFAAGVPRNERAAGRRASRSEREPVPVAISVPVYGAADAPDPVVDGLIDLGAVTVEFLVLALDPYPKKPGISFGEVVIGDTTDQEPSPFAALQRLKDRS